MAGGKYNGLCFDVATDTVAVMPGAKPEEAQGAVNFAVTGKVTPAFEQALGNANACGPGVAAAAPVVIPNASKLGLAFKP